jgi:3-carboxy-cis,cis-muconate cycloisomerase
MTALLPKAQQPGTPLIDLLARNPEISRHLSGLELERIVDPANYLGLAGEMVDRVLASERRDRA